jgi:hypothetical protein
MMDCWSRIGVATVAVLIGQPDAARPQRPAAARVLDRRSPVTYFIDEGNGTAGFRTGDRQLARWALEAWQRSAQTGLRFEAVAEPSTAIVRVRWADPSGGQYGEMRPLTVGGRPGAEVFIRPDVESLGEGIAARVRRDVLLRDSIVYLTCLHELGHALGLTHTADFEDIMYFFGYGGDVVDYFTRYRMQLRSRADIARTSGLSAADVRRIGALYPTRPLGQP